MSLTLPTFTSIKTKILNSSLGIDDGFTFCQEDYPRDWYQEEFLPYADEYLSLSPCNRETILSWMESYISPALQKLGDQMLLLAHYYMGGEIAGLTNHFGGEIGDSYQLALRAFQSPEKPFIVEAAVHFMGETISILAHPHQKVYITNPKAGCSMEAMAKFDLVKSFISEMNDFFGFENVIPICYVNTSGRVKALTGYQNGLACTSSNAKKVLSFALKTGKRVLFIPDRHLGENTAIDIGLHPEEIFLWTGESSKLTDRLAKSRVILFPAFCGVHTYFTAEMVDYWHDEGYNIIVHPESRHEVVKRANAFGSTSFIWDYVINDRAGRGFYAVGTEGHMIKNLADAAERLGIKVVNLGSANLSNGGLLSMGCGCATMSRNDPPHLVGLLDLLSKGTPPAANLILPGDIISETGTLRERLDEEGISWVRKYAKIALDNMINVTESKA